MPTGHDERTVYVSIACSCGDRFAHVAQYDTVAAVVVAFKGAADLYHAHVRNPHPEQLQLEGTEPEQ